MSKIGIGVCTYNRLDLLQKCLSGFANTISSTCRLIISSDGSTDGTDKWLGQQSHDWISGPNVGIAKNKNRLLNVLDDCDYIFLIEDDIVIKNSKWIEWYIRTSQESGIQHFSYHNKIQRARRNTTHYATTTTIGDHGTTGQLMFFTKEVLKRCGGFNEQYAGHGYEHLEYTKRINFAFQYGPLFLDSLEGHLCIHAPTTKSSTQATGKNGKLYKHFKRYYQRDFERFRYCEYKGEQR